MIRRAQWDVRMTQGGPVPRRGLWVALWTAAIAAEALALKPVLFPA